MRIGVVLPQTEIGADVEAVHACGRGVEELGFTHILTYDHVVGADPAVHPGWRGPYDNDSTFHEPMVLYGYLAAIVSLELVTGIVILPQRQTALVAKQAAEVDLLSGGRSRLGVGLGWNHVEYEALGQDFSTRGRRLEEQVGLLRRLWTGSSVTFTGEFDSITGAGLAPLPVQQPIPIWLGGQSEPAYRRMGSIADGWFSQMQPGPKLDEAIATVARAAESSGRTQPISPWKGESAFHDGRFATATTEIVRIAADERRRFTDQLARRRRRPGGPGAAMARCRRQPPRDQHHGHRPRHGRRPPSGPTGKSVVHRGCASPAGA